MSNDIKGMENELNELRKNVEKILIKKIGSSCIQTASNREKTIKKSEASKLEDLKLSSDKYLLNFKTSAKGQWVKQATDSFHKTSLKLKKV